MIAYVDHDPNLPPQPSSGIGAAPPPPAAPPRLIQILMHIRGEIDHADELAEMLRGHADKLEGPEPECSAQGQGINGGNGIIPEIFAALETLSSRMVNLRREVQRNCNLA